MKNPFVADCPKRGDDFGKVDAAWFPEGDVVESSCAQAPGFEGRWAVGVEAVVLDVDVHQVWSEFAESCQPVRLAADEQVDRFVDQAEVAAIDLLQPGDGGLDFLKQRGRVALVSQPNSAVAGQVGRSLGVLDVARVLQTDADQVAAERGGHVQAGDDARRLSGPCSLLSGTSESAVTIVTMRPARSTSARMAVSSSRGVWMPAALARMQMPR